MLRKNQLTEEDVQQLRTPCKTTPFVWQMSASAGILIPMKQIGLDLNLSTRKTRKQVFLEQMEQVVPWAQLEEPVFVNVVVRFFKPQLAVFSSIPPYSVQG